MANVVDYDGTQDLEETVVRFSADWCGPCKAFAPMFSKVAASADGEAYVVVDVDDYPEVAKEYGVMSIPTLLVYGERVDDHIGWARKNV